MTQQASTPRFRPVIRVFVSSTFTDLKHERDALQQKVFPELERLCARRQFQFQAIDLRWGVPTEANLDHRTMSICFEELHRAQEISPQPNFLVLLGNRYGWRPLPETVFPAEFERLAQHAASEKERKTLEAWYRRDDNAVPPVYILQSRRQRLGDGRDYTIEDAWRDVQPVLWDIINRAFPATDLTGRFAQLAGPDEPLPSVVRFQASATEQEIWRGALGVADAGEHVLAFVREIKNIRDFSEPEEIRDFADVADSGAVDPGPQQALVELKAALRARLGETNYHEFRHARLVGSEGARDKPGHDVTTTHLDELCAQVLRRLEPIITRQMDEYWHTAGTEIPPERALELEENEHRRFGLERAPRESFTGREEELKAIRDYLDGDSRRPLVVHGASGCGKTALMARAAQEAESKWRPVVRFIGVTPHSSDARSLLSSLCQELRSRHPLPNPLPAEIGDLTRELNQHLYAATAGNPVVLFLDALDQLSDTGAGRFLLWLPTGDLPEHAKLVVSCLSDRAEDVPAGEPYRALKQREVGIPEFLDATALPQDQARALLFDRWLSKSGRRLNNEQTKRIERQLLSDPCRHPLYLRLLFEEARLWRSYDSASELADTTAGLLDRLLNRLKEPNNHGEAAEHALSYLASARRGLTELEILEVLYRDPEYRQVLEKGAALTGHRLPDSPPRIPVAIWSRLRFDLAPYLAEIAAPGATVLNFYHRQVADAVRSLFLNPGQQADLRHSRLADYFEKQEPGLRRTDELPWQLAEAESWRRLYDLLADLDFFEQAWNENRFDLKNYWVQVEDKAGLKMTDAYRPVLDAPELVLDTDKVWNVGMLLSNTGHPEEALKLRAFLTGHFRETGDRNRYQASLGNQALILYGRGDLDEAMKLYKEQERICRELGNKDGLQGSLGNQAVILAARGDIDEAMKLYKEQERICRELGNKDSLSISLGNQANILADRGDLDEAMKIHKEEERICRELGNKAGLQRSLGNQATILQDRGDLDEAMKLHKEEERICRELGNPEGLAYSLANQALLMSDKLNRPKDALPLAEEAYRLASEHGYATLAQQVKGILDSIRAAEATEHNQRGIAHYMAGDMAKAVECYRQALTVYQAAASEDGQCVAMHNIGDAYHRKGDLDSARQWYENALGFAAPEVNIKSVEGLAFIYLERDDRDKSREWLERCLVMCRKLAESNPDSETVHYALAQVLWALGKTNDAREALKTAIRRFPSGQTIDFATSDFELLRRAAPTTPDIEEAFALLRKARADADS